MTFLNANIILNNTQKNNKRSLKPVLFIRASLQSRRSSLLFCILSLPAANVTCPQSSRGSCCKNESIVIVISGNWEYKTGVFCRYKTSEH